MHIASQFVGRIGSRRKGTAHLQQPGRHGVRMSRLDIRNTLGFSIDFLHGEPPFYGSVSRGGACVHLKFVHEPVFAVGAQDREGLITAFIEVENVKALYAEYVTAGATFDQKLKTQAWGGRDFVVRDLDGNGLCFVGLPA